MRSRSSSSIDSAIDRPSAARRPVEIIVPLEGEAAHSRFEILRYLFVRLEKLDDPPVDSRRTIRLRPRMVDDRLILRQIPRVEGEDQRCPEVAVAREMHRM